MKKSLLLFSAAALVLVLTMAKAYSSTTSRFQFNGVDANTTACLNNCVDGTALIGLASSQGGGSPTTWYVYITVYGHDSQGNLTQIGGAGQIPASMVSGNGQTSLTLNLDTNTAGLQLQYCVADQFLNYTCSAYAGGMMNVTWTPTKAYSSSGSFVDQMSSGHLLCSTT